MQNHKYEYFLTLIVAVAMLASGLTRSSPLRLRSNSFQLDPTPSSSSLILDETVAPSIQRVASAVSLVSGTTVGAGILALASVSQKPGFIPSAICLCCTWVLMASTGLLIAEVTCNIRSRRETIEHKVEEAPSDIGLITLTSRLLGSYGSFPAACMYVFIHYALLIAYIAESGDIINKATNIGGVWGCLAFTSIMGGCVAFAPSKWVELVNNMFFVVVVASFLALVGLQAGHVQMGNLTYQNYGAVAPIIPILLVALVYHNVVPTVCMQLDYHKGSIISSVLLGSFIPLVMFLLWNAVVLGGIQDYEMLTASGAVVDPLELLRSSVPSSGRMLTEGLITVFSESAIVTSFIGFVIGLMEFYSDLFPGRSRSDLGLYGLVLIPSTVVAIADPTIFLNALDAAGTYGVSLLFGIIPAVLALVLRRSSAIDAEIRAPEEGVESCSRSADEPFDVDNQSTDIDDGTQHSVMDESFDSDSPNQVELAVVRRGGYSNVSTDDGFGIVDFTPNNSSVFVHPPRRVSHYTVFLPGGDGSLYMIIAVITGIIIAKTTYDF